MQEGFYDYYNDEDDISTGCCLNCSDSYVGCLCYNCKCLKCYWYSKEEYGDGGYCEMVGELKKIREEESIDKFLKKYSKNKPKRKQKLIIEFEKGGEYAR